MKIGTVRFLALCAVLLAAVMPAVSVAQSWQPNVSNLWSDTANWQFGALPTVNEPVQIASGQVGMDVSAAIASLDLPVGTGLSLRNGVSLSVGGLTNNGSLQVNAGVNTTDLRFSGSQALTGNGRVLLSDSPNNRLFPTGSGTLTQTAGHSIEGAGQLLVNSGNMINSGLVLASQPTNALIIDPLTTFTNNGQLQAVTGSTLTLQSGLFINHTVIDVASGATLDLNTATVQGGVIAGAGQVIPRNGSTLDGITLNVQLVQANGQFVSVQNGLVHNGDWQLNAGVNTTDIRFVGSQVLTGNGRVLLSDSPNNRLFPTGAGTLTLESGHSIEGAGQLLVNSGDMINRGLVRANQPVNALVIDPLNTFTNDSQLQAAAGSTLTLQSGLFVNHTVIDVADGATLDLNTATVQGGVISVAGTGQVVPRNGSTLDGITLNGLLAQANGQFVSVQNSLVHNGTWQLNAGANATDLRLSGGDPVTGQIPLQGQGELLLSNSINNRVFPTGGKTLVLEPFYRIRGAGQLLVNSGDMINRHLIIADAPTALVIDPLIRFDNQGTVVAQGAGGLVFNPGLFVNTGHEIQVRQGSQLVLNGATVQGGVLATTGTGQVVPNNGPTLDGITLNGLLTQANGQFVSVQNNLAHNGDWQLNAGVNATDIRFVGSQVLTGNGRVLLSDSPNNRLFPTGAGTLTLESGHSIAGAGQLLVNSGDMINRGLVLANQPTNALTIDPLNTFTNDGQLQVAVGSKLTLQPGLFINHTAIDVADGATLDLNGTTVQGGVIATTGTGQVIPRNAPILDGITLNGPLVQANGQTVSVQNLVHNGDWQLNAGVNTTDIRFVGSQVLTGNGRVLLSDSPNNRLFSTGSGTLMLTLEVGHSIAGAGQLLVNSGDMINRGLVLANQPTALVIDPLNSFTNDGQLQVAVGSKLTLQPGLFINHTAIDVADGATLDLNGTTVQGGVIATTGTGQVVPRNAPILDGITLNGPLVQVNGQTVSVQNSLVHNGDWQLNAGVNATDIHFLGSQALAGNGRMLLSDSPNNRLFPTGSGTLTQELGHSIAGAGQLLVNSGDMINRGLVLANQPLNALVIDPLNRFTNAGSLHAQGAAGISLNPGVFENQGQVQVDVGSHIQRTGGYLQTAGTTQVDGLLTATGIIQLDDGILQGTGSLTGQAVGTALRQAGGAITPGNGIGVLSIGGNAQFSGGILGFELLGTTPGTQYDQLQVNGQASVSGGIVILPVAAVPGGAPFLPALGDSFVLLTASGGITGNFNPQFSVLPQFAGRTFQVRITATQVIADVVAVTNQVPTAAADSLLATEDTVLNLAAPGLLANDNDPEGVGLLALPDTAPQHGQLVLGALADGSLSYTPDANYCGGDSFTYHAFDSVNSSLPARVSINVQCVNDAPTATAASLTVNEDQSGVLPVVTADVDLPNDVHQLSILTQPAMGAVSLIGGQLVYAPLANASGSTSFTYRVSDQGGATVDGTASITVNAVNDPPAAQDDSGQTAMDTAFTTVNVLLNDSDVEGDPISLLFVDVTSARGGDVVNLGNGSFRYTPPKGLFGQDSFIYRIGDGQGGVGAGQVNITITPPSIAPMLSAAGVSVNGNASPDVLLLLTDPASGNHQLISRDGADGSLIQRTDLGNRYLPLAMDMAPDVNANGMPEVVILAEDRVNSLLRVQTRDSSTGVLLSTFFVNGTQQGIALRVQDDLNADGRADILMLLKNRQTGFFSIQAHDGATGVQLATVWRNGGHTEQLMTLLPDGNADGIRELAHLGRDRTRSSQRVLFQDGASNAIQSRMYSIFRMIPVQMLALSDMNANGSAELGILGRLASGHAVLELRDSQSKLVINSLYLGKNRAPVGISGVADRNADGVADVAVLTQHEGLNRSLLEVFDPLNRSLLQRLRYGNGLTPEALLVIGDANGNGVEEAAVVLHDGASGQNSLVIRDLATGGVLADLPAL